MPKPWRLPSSEAAPMPKRQVFRAIPHIASRRMYEGLSTLHRQSYQNVSREPFCYDQHFSGAPLMARPANEFNGGYWERALNRRLAGAH